VTLVPGAFVVAMMTLFVIAAGDRPGIAPGTGRGLADAATVRGSIVRVTGSGPSLVRVARAGVAGGTDGVAGGTDGTEAGGTGLGSGRRAAASQVHRGPSNSEQRGRAAGNPQVHTAVRPATWYVCPPTPATQPPRDPQLACRRPPPRTVPHTAHRPGPLDFAW
jgi:hypothetical protein